MQIIEKLSELAEVYIKKYPPDTGYTRKAAQAVYDAYRAGKLPGGTNVGVQLALQYDGVELGSGDLVDMPGDEKRLPYLASYSLDVGADCMDFVRNISLLLFGKNPGDWTQGAFVQNKAKQVTWSERRPMDLLLFNFKSGRDASHAALYLGGGLMLHTRSKSKPLMVTADSIYDAADRAGTGVFRIYSDEEYNSLIIGAESEGEIMIKAGQKDGATPGAVYLFQGACIAANRKILQDGKTWPDLVTGVNNGRDGSNGVFLQGVIKAIQAKYKLPQTGDVDALTYGYLVSEISAEDTAKLNDLNAALAAAKAKAAAALPHINAAKAALA
jgi:cell wall-associated NlpC family hydrolase